MTPLSDRIEALIAAQQLQPGDRLPAERQLAAELGVSRSRLREAIQQLTSRGLLVSQQGGGTFVTAPEDADPVRAALLSLAPLAHSQAGYWRDVMEIRKSLEGDAAAFAAMRADADDRARMRAACAALSTALCSDLTGQGEDSPRLGLAKLDAHFHMTIVRAAHNAVLYQVMTGLEGLVEASISGSLTRLYRQPGVPGELDAHHRRILEAVVAGDGDSARSAATEHLLFVEDRLECLEEDFARYQRSSHALRHIALKKEKLP